MKRIFALLMLFALVGFSACSKYDDSDIRQDIEDLDKRVTTLEELTAQLDSKIRNGMLISSVKALTGEKSGWLITFSDNSTIEVEHGLDGANGANGANGTNGIDGKTPYIYTDSEGYWCINYNGAKPETDDESERILDGEGNPITSRGKDGLNGTNGKDGVDGISQYVHIRYSAYENGKDGEDNHCLLLTPNTYIGIVTTDSEDCPEDATAFTWSRIMADNGSGSTTQYMHIMYSATEDGANMTADSDENSYYIGIGTSTSTTPSTNPADYKWSRFRGDGNDGEDGTSWYVHIRYSANINGHQMLASPAADSKYIGLLTNNNPIASSDYRDYKWSRYCGKDGADGDTYYTYVAYSANADGSEMTTDPMADTKYVGFATAKSAPADYTGYTWSQYRGDDGATGAQGPQGVPGNDGTSAYTWIRYADNSNGDGISTSPAGKTYIGVLTTPTNSVPAANTFPWTKFVGDNGATGAQGPQGVAGADGTSAYTWIRYAKDVNGTDMSASPTGMTYIGVLTTPTNVLPAVGEFPWTKFVGDKGETGAQGPQGVPGTSAYTWIRYAKDVNGTDMSASPAGMTYIGVLTTTTNTEPVVGEFVWTKFVGADGATGAQGPQGVTGANGTSAYTWIRYAKDVNGTDMSPSPEGMTYIGVLTTDTNVLPAVGEFVWTKFVGTDGATGERGPQGVPGTSAYTWIRYAKDVNGTDMSPSPEGMTYIGVLTTTTNTEPAVGEFVWTKFVGTDGATGAQGPQGVPGTSAYTWIRYATSAGGADMSTSPAGMTYIGVLTTDTNVLPAVGEFVWTKFVGDNGLSVWIAYSANADGSSMTLTPQANSKYIGIKTAASRPDTYEGYDWTQYRGNDGADGADGQSVYVAYSANADGSSMTTTKQADTKFIGIATGTSTPATYEGYSWFQLVGDTGATGATGLKGDKGDTGDSVWFAYAKDGIGTDMSTTWSAGLDYVGFATGTSQPDLASAYAWSKFVGPQGPKGDNAYVHIRYSAKSNGGNADGSEMTTTVNTYIGIYTDNNATASTNPSKYTWGQLKGDKGDKGDEGTSQYVNIRYATSDAGADFDDDPAGMSYLGILVTTTSDHEDIDNPAKYTWVKFVGPQGPKGNPGTNGTNGDYVKVVPHATKEKVLVLTLYRGEADESDPENIKPAGSVIASYEIPYCGYGIAAIEENEKYVQFNILDNTGETPVTKGYRLGKTKVVPTSIKIANPVFDGVIAGYSGANGGVQTLKLHVSPSDALLTPGNVHIDYVGKGTISSITRAADDRFNDKAFFNVTGVTRTDATKGDWDVTFTVNQNALEEGATPESISTLFTGMLFDVCVTYPKNPESLNTILSSDSDYELPESYSDWATSYSRSTNSFTFTNKPMVLNNFEVTMTPATATITSNVANVEAVSNLLITSEYNYPSSYVDVSDHTVTARAFDKNGNPLDNLAGFDTSGKAYYTSLTRDAGTVANAAYSYILKPNQAGFTALRAANLATFAVGCKIVFTISVRYSYNGTYGAEPETFTVTVTYDDDPLDLPSFNATLNRVNGWVHGTNSASDVEYCVYASQVGSIPTVPGDEIPYSNGISTALVNNSANNYGSIMYSGKSIYNHLATNGYDVENAVIKYEYTLIKEYMRTKNSGITGVAWGDWKDVTPGTHIEVAPNGQISITTAYNPGSGALNKNKEDGMIQVECVITIDNRTWGTFYLVIRTQD